MEPKLSKLEYNVSLLKKANTSNSLIATTLNKPLKSIENAIGRINKKKEEVNSSKKVIQGRVTKVTPREKRVINRDLEKSPKKTKKRLLEENSLGFKRRTLIRVLRKEG